MMRFRLVMAGLLLAGGMARCRVEPAEKKETFSPASFEITGADSLTVSEFQPCDILVKPNHNWLPGSAWVAGGRGFGHVAVVIRGSCGQTAEEALQKAVVFESQARAVSPEFEIREARGYQEGDDFRVANVTFGRQNAGFRYRLRPDLTPAQRDSILRFIQAQDPDVSCWRSQKKFTAGWTDKNSWYCSLLVWQAFYAVLGADLDPNGGVIIYPNDLIASPFFNNTTANKNSRVRF